MKQRNCGPSGVGEVKVCGVVVAVIAELTVQGIVGDRNASRNEEILVQVGYRPSAVNVVVDL